jgi:hypothetical protein
MKEIKKFKINSAPMSKSATVKTYTVTGDAGSSFSLIVMNEDDHFYNFPENTDPVLNTRPAPAFTATPVELNIVTLGGSGVYSNTINFPAVTDDDKYRITLIAKQDSIVSDSLSTENHYFSPAIDQYDNPTITFSLLHSASSVIEPSNITSTGISSKVGPSGQTTFSISWDITLNDGQCVIARQPLQSDFEFTTTKKTRTAGSSAVNLELTNVEGLSAGMAVSGTGIASSSETKYIIAGYKDYENTYATGDIYNTPVAVETVNGKDVISEDKGGTVFINNASTFVVDRTITFTGKGAAAARIFSGLDVEITNLALTIDPIVTTTDAAVSNSTTIPITSTLGIKAVDTVLMTGIGVTASSPHVDAVSAGVNVTVSSAQTLENGQTVTFTGSSRSAKVTCDVKINSYGRSDLTLTLNLDNILTVT